jgi:hypothetical protein
LHQNVENIRYWSRHLTSNAIGCDLQIVLVTILDF